MAGLQLVLQSPMPYSLSQELEDPRYGPTLGHVHSKGLLCVLGTS